MNYYESAIELIGNTPLLKVNNIINELNLKANVFVKIEFFNPAGSVKDRAAKEMIEDAERKGLINKDTVLIEPTSGNTGIGLALIAAIKGYKIKIVMPETMSIERRAILSQLGAELILTDGSKGMKGAIEKADELKNQIANSFIPGQFVNRANAVAHIKTTGPEIYNALDGNIDIFVAGVGTGGTVTGVGEYLKSKNKDIEIVAVEPYTSAVLSNEKAGKHGLQGLGAGFVPEVLNTKIYDKVVKVKDEEAYEMGRLLAKKEGLLCGISSGAALFAATTLAKMPENKGKNIVALLPDTGDRYISTPLFNK